MSTASCASGRAKRGARGRACKRAYDNRHYVSRRNFTGHRILHNKRADYVMPDYRMTVRILNWALHTAALWLKSRNLRSFVEECGRSLSLSGELPSDGAQARWLRWASAHADAVDPLKSGRLNKIIQTLEASTIQSDCWPIAGFPTRKVSREAKIKLFSPSANLEY